MKLSILVPSVSSRRSTFLPKALNMLYDQYEALSPEDQKEVEIIFLIDNKTIMLGDKRNKMVELAQGLYTVHADDDDRISPDYIKSLLEATDSDADVITFNAEVRLNGGPPKICDYSKEHKEDYNGDKYYRIPNHICCVKKEVGLLSEFPNVLYGEDSGYSKNLLPHLITEHKIDKILYYYDYNKNTSVAQEWKQKPQEPLVDLIILSKANTKEKQAMTAQAVRTAFMNSNGIPMGITVLEQGAGRYARAKTILKPGEFNYNAFANYGASLGKAEWIVIANNDLIFKEQWLHNLIKVGHPVMSPHEPKDKRQSMITQNTTGYINGTHFSGWCFIIKRSLWEDIGGFDEAVSFYCSDDAVIEQVKAKGITPMLVKDSLVEHIASQTLTEESNQDELKWPNVKIFNDKYGKNKFANNRNYQEWLRRNP